MLHPDMRLYSYSVTSSVETSHGGVTREQESIQTRQDRIKAHAETSFLTRYLAE